MELGKGNGMARGERPESDVQADPAAARSRETGGVPDPAAPDRHSTTGTTPSDEFVGRVTGDDPGDVDESGAERRAEAAREEAEHEEGERQQDDRPGGAAGR